MPAFQDLGLVVLLAGVGLAWILLLTAIVYVANSRMFVRVEPPAPEPPVIEADEEEEAPPELDEADRPMAVVILTTARGPYEREP